MTDEKKLQVEEQLETQVEPQANQEVQDEALEGIAGGSYAMTHYRKRKDD